MTISESIGLDMRYSKNDLVLRPPTEQVPMTYAAWLAKAKEGLSQSNIESDHYYLQTGDDSTRKYVAV